MASKLKSKTLLTFPHLLSPWDVIFIKTASFGHLVRSELVQVKAPYFEIKNKTCPEPYWIKLPLGLKVWALKLTPWVKPLAVSPPPAFHPGKVLRPELLREHQNKIPTNFADFWNWDASDPRMAQEFYTVEEREWREYCASEAKKNRNKKKPQPKKIKPNSATSEWYSVLGVKGGVTLKGLKKAYKANSFKYHPDRCKDANAAEMFLKVAQAYENLVKLFSQKG